MWKILTIIASVSMILSFLRGRNSIWGGAATGLIVGIIISVFKKFDWLITGRAVVVGILVGVIAEMLGIIADYLKNKT